MGPDRVADLVNAASKYLTKAIEAREGYYKGMEQAAAKALDEKQPNLGVRDAKYRFGKSVVATQLIADNKWHMAQSRTFALMAMARGVFVLITEQRHTNRLLEENNNLLKEVRNALRSR